MEKILVVDDEAIIRNTLERILTEERYAVTSVSTGTDALSSLATSDVDLVLLDLNLPDVNGIEVLRQAKELDPDLLVIVVTGYASVESAVEALKLGAYDYIKKPFKADVIKLITRLAIEAQRLKKEVRLLRRRVKVPAAPDIIADLSARSSAGPCLPRCSRKRPIFPAWDTVISRGARCANQPLAGPGLPRAIRSSAAPTARRLASARGTSTTAQSSLLLPSSTCQALPMRRFCSTRARGTADRPAKALTIARTNRRSCCCSRCSSVRALSSRGP